jgi:MFS family permease
MSWRHVLTAAVLVSALGYFVDVYDLLLFSIVRVPSLTGLGLSGAALLDRGVLLLNVQMAGLLVGGVLWGILGDKRGRRSVLFGSIALYSVANLLNAFVTNVDQYAALRFVAGVGLAGELGAAVTLVSEMLPKESRGYGTAIVAGVGILGAVFAALVGRWLSWRIAFALGGVLGLLLLVMRVRLAESGLFAALPAHVPKGRLRTLLADRKAALRWLCLVLVGVPVWYGVGILVTFSPELSVPLKIGGVVNAGLAILWCYVGIAVGGFALGALSQRVGNRRLFLALGIAGVLVASLVFLELRWLRLWAFYALCACLGAATGYWTVLMTSAAESFGTNVRATVVTTVPNLIRGSVVPMTLVFTALRAPLGLVGSALALGVGVCALALVALAGVPETHGASLDFVQGDSTPPVEASADDQPMAG